MENRFKLRISRVFCSSFRSCRPRNLSDVTKQPVFVPHNHSHLIQQLFSPKPRPSSSICGSKRSETAKTVQNSCFLDKEDLCPRRKISDRNTLLLSAEMDGRKCPPASPISPLNTYHKFQGFRTNSKESKSRKKTNKKTNLRNKKCDRAQNGLSKADNFKGWFSSDDDDDQTTLFTSKSLSSDSSDQSFYQTRARCNNQIASSRRRRAQRKDSEMGLMPILEGKVKDSFAVVKCSSDPYNDFRTSMVEMIVEREIFGGKDLENLLQCFLSLNSYHHHRVIIEVFTEIWDALFSNWPC